MSLPIAFSPCPNDTFAFHAWVHNLVEGEALDVTFGDIQHLNEWALHNRYPLIKLSYATLGRVLDDYVLLPSGSALGHNCGPLLVAGQSHSSTEIPNLRIAVPGKDTTAYLLLRALLPEPASIHFCTYDEVVPLIQKGEVDAGLVIHETRFTYQQQGLYKIADVGQLWEERYNAPIPLGGIAAHRSLGTERISQLHQSLQQSIQYAWDNPTKSLPYILEHSIEKDPTVVQNHIDLYVNQESYQLSTEAIQAVDHLFATSRKLQLLPENSNSWLLEKCTNAH